MLLLLLLKVKWYKKICYVCYKYWCPSAQFLIIVALHYAFMRPESPTMASPWKADAVHVILPKPCPTSVLQMISASMKTLSLEPMTFCVDSRRQRNGLFALDGTPISKVDDLGLFINTAKGTKSKLGQALGAIHIYCRVYFPVLVPYDLTLKETSWHLHASFTGHP